MISEKNSGWLATTVICLLLLTTSCTHLTEKTAALSLKFTPEDSTTYRIITEAEDRIQFEGSLLENPHFKDKRNQNRIEMTFTQQIQSTDANDNAVAKITIKELKYLSIYQNNPVLDFDSTRDKKLHKHLAKVIGQSYTIKIAPTGKVMEVLDVEQARAAVKGRSLAGREALKLLSPDVIKQYHTITALPVGEKKQFRIGDNWSSVKVFDFRLMGTKSYEKIYTLKEIKDVHGRRTAFVEMNVIPGPEMPEQLHKEQVTSSLLRMFDNDETYTGELMLDITAGKVENYSEKLRSDWVIIDPAAKEEDDEEPGVIRMRAIRSYSLKKID